ncbi:hypothetical protein C7S15_4418 [Burkholderia cepacia]|nr:hypothetical protein [Burkholderia cepacia]
MRAGGGSEFGQDDGSADERRVAPRRGLDSRRRSGRTARNARRRAPYCCRAASNVQAAALSVSEMKAMRGHA